MMFGYFLFYSTFLNEKKIPHCPSSNCKPINKYKLYTYSLTRDHLLINNDFIIIFTAEHRLIYFTFTVALFFFSPKLRFCTSYIKEEPKAEA